MSFRNYATDEYRAAYKAAGGDPGPFALEGNSDPEKRNYRTSRRKQILMGVMHITAGMSDYDLPDASAEGTTRYGADTTRDASWHVCIDSDGIIPSIRDSYVAWHAGVADIANVNDASLGMEIGTGATDWRKKPDAWVQRTIRNAAVWWAPRVVKYGIPIRLENSRTAIESAIIAGRKIGFTSHKIIAPSNRTDPGWVGVTAENPGVDTFPWTLFFTYLREEIARFNGTTEEDIMATIDELRAVIRQELAGVPADVWEHLLVNRLTQEKYRAGSYVEGGAIWAQAASKDSAKAVAELAALRTAFEAVAANPDLSAAEITAAAKAGAAAALDEKITGADVTLTVDPPA